MSETERVTLVGNLTADPELRFTLDRYGHLYPEVDLTLRERLQAIEAARNDAS